VERLELPHQRSNVWIGISADLEKTGCQPSSASSHLIEERTLSVTCSSR
jgi:hypothetical protein